MTKRVSILFDEAVRLFSLWKKKNLKVIHLSFTDGCLLSFNLLSFSWKNMLCILPSDTENNRGNICTVLRAQVQITGS